MVNSYKACMKYREMQSKLSELDLIENLIYLKNYYKNDSELFKKWLNTNFSNNLFTFQAIILFREIIINSWTQKIESFKDKNNLSYFINSYIKITQYLLDTKKAKLEEVLFWLKHSQFWYQKMSDELYIFLNFYLNYYWNSDILSKIIIKELWINISDAIKLAYLISNNAETHFYQDLDNKNWLYNEEVLYFLKNFSIEITDFKNELTINSNKSDKFFDYNSMLYNWLISIFDKPLLKIWEKYTCIFPVLILNRVTTAISFLFSREDIYNWVKISKIFWDNNQNFIYNLLITNLKWKINIINTDDNLKNYKWKTPPNPDIILESEDSILFIECKSTSIHFKSKSTSKLQDSDKDRLKGYMKKMYEKLSYYNDLEIWENYFWIIKSNKKVIPLITFLENPYIDWYYSNLINNEIIKENIILENTVNNNRIFISDNLAIIFIIDLIKKIWLDKLLLEFKNTEYTWYDIDSIVKNIYSKNDLSYDNIKFKNDLIDILKNDLNNLWKQ